MADAAQLKLQVGLDLTFFRQQLAQLGTVAVGYQMPINIKLDPLTIQQELSRLKKKIGKTQYTVKIDTNIENEINNADRLVKALQRVQREGGRGRSGLPVDIRQLRKTKGQGGFSAADIKTLFGAAIAGGLLDEKTLGKTREQMVTAFASIGKDSIEGLLNGLSSADASIRAAAESIGETLIATTKASLGMRSPSKKFEEIGKNVGLGFEKGVLSSMDAAFNALERKMQQRTRVLDAMARGIFHMLGMDPASMMAAQRQKLLPPAINWQSSVATPPQYQSKRGTMLTGAPAPTLIGGAPGPFGLLPRTTRAGAMGDMMRMLSQGAGEGQPGKLALSPEAAKARIDAIISQYLRVVEVQIKESFSAPAELKKQLNVFSYLAQSLRDAEQRVKQNKINSAVDSLINALENLVRKTQLTLGIERVSIADLGANRPLLAGTSYPALPAAGETGKNRVRISTGNPFESLPMLPAAGGTTSRSQMPLHAVSTGAYVGQPPFMRAPSVPPSMATGGGQPPIPPSGGRGGSSGFGGFGNAMAGIKLPNAGLVSELGSEFAMAAKQVLLFGTAYKALAFLTDFPGKVSEAVAQLQTFNNTLKAITPSSDEFRIANQFILDTVDKYNVPLQSAREGFTNLYASMEPAGFKGNEIRDIFTGVSQAAATFGMSADRVDRVNYAFAQMASKGQVMSEELKGQLGDVLPGAVAIFAKAAGFTGSNAMVDFTKAMEDGRYKGEAMKQLLINVGIVMKDKFAKGAEGAAQSFQGQMNAMATATQKLYESFTPVANLFASNVVKPLTEGIKVAADGFNAFFTGAATKTAGGFTLSQELEKLRPAFKGIADNVKQLLPLIQNFATATLGLAKILLQVASSPFAGYLIRIYLPIVALTTAIQVLNLQALIPMIANLLRAIPAFIAYNAALIQGISSNKSLQLSMALTGQTAGVTAGKIRLFGAALGAIGIGAIVLGIGALIERFTSLGAAIDGVRQSTKQTVQGISSLANTGDVGGLKNILADTKKQIDTFKNLRSYVGGGVLGGPSKQLTQAVFDQMKALGLERFVSKDITGKPYVSDFINASNLIEEKLKGLEKAAGSVQEKLPLAGKIADDIRKQAEKANNGIKPIPGAGGDDKEAAKRLKDQQNLADALSKDQTKTDIERQVARFENEKNMINMAYDLREARANSFQKETIRFQKELFNIEMERQRAVLNAGNAIAKAQGNVAGGTAGATGLLQGSTGISSGAHFDVRRQDGGYISPQQARALFEASVAKQLQLTSSYGPRKAPTAGASTFHRGVDLAGPANTPLNLAQGYSMVGAGMKSGLGYTASVRGPQGEMYDVGHLQQPRAGVPSGKVTARQKSVALADQQTRNALQDRGVNLTLAEAEAYKKAEVATASYVASIVPIAEQELQNRLLENKISLTQASASPGLLSAQLAYSEQQIKTSAAIKVLNDDIAKLSKVKGADGQITKEAQNQIDGYTAAINELKASLPTSEVQLLTKSILEQADAIISKAAASRRARSDENRINELIISGLSREQAEAKLAAEALEKDYAVAITAINDKIKEYSDTLAKLNLQKAAGIALDKGQIEEYERLRKAIEDLEKKKATAEGKKDEATSTPLPKEKTFKESITSEKAKISEQLKEMTKPANMLIGLAKQIGSSFSDAFVKVIDGTASAQEALAGFFKSIGDYLIQYGAQMLSLAIIKGILGLFGNGAAFDSGGITKNAKGNAFTGGGIAKFATGGIVNGPTLFPFADGGAMRMGLMGEAGPEAILPLQRGVDGALGVRAAMGGNGMGGSSSPILNMNFETSTINGVEYVSRDQLEAAMVQTRRQASSDGAKRGMAMTLDKIQQSPQTRRRIGM